MNLFAFFGMWETTLAVAAGAASIPVIIHLLNRRRFRIVVWAAMKFLLAAQKQNTRRMRLEQLVLLAARVLLVLLIVLAMASVMPWAERVWGHFWPDGAGPIMRRAARTHKIIVLDASMSMNLQGAGGRTAFERARDLAARMVNKSPGGDGFSVLLMKETPVWVVSEPSQDLRKVAGEIELLQATDGNASVAAALNAVAAKVSEASGRFPSREVYFFTDLQQATWLGGRAPGKATVKDAKAPVEKTPLQDLQKLAQTIFVDVGRDNVTNLAVTSLKLNDSLVATGDLVSFSGTVQNFGQDSRKARIALLVGMAGDARDSLTLRVEREEPREIKAGENAPVPFSYKFNRAGIYAVQMRLLAEDAGRGADDLAPDNARTIIVTVRDNVPVMLVNGKPALDRFDRATEYLRLALNPFGDAAPAWVPLRPKVVSAAQFTDGSEGDLAAFDCVFLCDVPRLGSGELRRLQTHLRRGGGIVIAAGNQMAEHLDAYNRLLFKGGNEILPARLIKKVTAPPEHHFILQANEEAFLEPPLKAFADDDDRFSLRTARFRQYLQAKPAADAKARTILSFMPEVQPNAGAPFDKNLPTNDVALIEWNPPLPRVKDTVPAAGMPTRYRGKVILATSTLNMDWNSWPGSPSFGAMMQELTRLAVSGKLRERSFLAGQTLEEYLPGADTEIDVTVSPPKPDAIHRRPAIEKAILEGKYKVRDFQGEAQTKRTEGVGDVSVLHWASTDRSGIYLVNAGTKEFPVAVNVPAATQDQQGSESDLSRVDKAKLADAFHGWDFQVVTDPESAAHAAAREQDEMQEIGGKMGPQIARILLWGVLFLLFLEVVLAWVFGHYSAAAGAMEPAAAGSLGPLLIAAVTAVVFAAGAYTLFQYRQSGDFLNFWPLEGVRAWVEGLLGIPPPLPGEGTHWDLEYFAFLSDNVSDPWLPAGVALAAAVLIFFVYRAEGPNTSVPYKLLLGGLRVAMILLTLFVLGPQAQVRFDRQGWPDVALIIDDSRSMGEPDHYQDSAVQEAVKRLGEQIRKREKGRLPGRIKALQDELAQKKALVEKAPDSAARLEIEPLAQKIQAMENAQAQVNSPGWRPTRLQLAQAIIADEDHDWIRTFIDKRRMKLHVFHLDAAGRVIRLTDADGKAGDVGAQDDPRSIDRAHKAIAALEAEGKDSRLGGAIRQVLDYYRGSALSAVVMLTDGVTTRDETILQVSEYAAQKGVPLFFVGIGDDHPIRDLKLHDLQVDDVVYVNDTVYFEASLTGAGYKDLTVPVVLKVRDADGRDKEVDRKRFKVDVKGASVKVRLKHQPTEIGRKLYIMEVELPKVDRPDKAIPPIHTRLERTIDVLDSKLIKALYVEGSPRYEFRFIKALLERERPDEKKKRSIDLKVVLLDADQDFPAQDRTALADFPPTKEELDAFDVVILGDCNPRHPKLGEKRLRNLADFVRGEDSKGKKGAKTGGGLLMIAGPNFNPHAFADTPLAAVLPIEPLKAPGETDNIKESYRLQLTPVGRQHPIFRLNADDAENQAVWQKLSPMFWCSEGYRTKPLAEVLAVHPFRKAISPNPGQDPRHPLAVQMFVGSGRSMFFGFEETWRWRFRDNEQYFNKFWLGTARYLSRSRITRTVLRLDRQTPYRVGEPIKVTVQFPDNTPLPGKPGVKETKTDVRVIVEFRPNAAGDEKVDPEIQTLKLAKVEGSWSNYSEFFTRTREGKYHFWLSSPDVSKEDPSGQKPSADAKVELPPGELERLRMNQEELTQAAEATRGRFYTLVNAGSLPDDLPAGARPSLSTSKPPWLLWNWVPVFLLFLFLLTSEWVLRKRKHLL